MTRILISDSSNYTKNKINRYRFLVILILSMEKDQNYDSHNRSDKEADWQNLQPCRTICAVKSEISCVLHYNNRSSCAVKLHMYCDWYSAQYGTTASVLQVEQYACSNTSSCNASIAVHNVVLLRVYWEWCSTGEVLLNCALHLSQYKIQ